MRATRLPRTSQKRMQQATLLAAGHTPLFKSLRCTAAALLACTCLTGGAAYAQNATWNGSTTDWNTPTNWTPNTVPTGTATFSATGSTSVDNASGFVSIGAINFDATAQAYTVTIDNPFLINGAGVANNSANTQTFNVFDALVFQNGSSGNTGPHTVVYNNSSSVAFIQTSNAGNSHASYSNNAVLSFNDSSSAGAALFTNNIELDFFGSSTAANAFIINNGNVTFNNATTAANATIVNSAAGSLAFNNTSSAGSASVDNFGALNFNNLSTAGSASLVNESGGAIVFANSSGGGGAIIDNMSGASLTFADSSSASSATISNSGTLNFTSASSGGSANISNLGGAIAFANTSTAGNAAILNSSGGTLIFNDTSTAGNAVITNLFSMAFNNSASAGNAIVHNVGPSGFLSFNNLSSAGNAIITNDSSLAFNNSATAANATITNNRALTFNNAADGGSAIVTNNGAITFNNSSTADNATISTNSGGTVSFLASSTGGNARFITNAGGTFDMSGLTSGGMTAGSIEGAGNYFLGANALTVGSNNLSTIVSGVISDGGASGGTGGSLIKVGTGTLVLAGNNTYTGGTTISAGTLQIGNGGTTGSILGNVLDNSVLAFNRSDTVTFGGLISGSGALTQLGPGTLVLTSNDAYTGGTTIAAGTLQLGNGGTTGSIIGDVLDNGTLAFNRSDTMTFGGLVTGNGGLTQLGPGTVILTTNDTYTGVTTIATGTLQLGNGGTSGSIVGNVVDNGTLAFNRSDLVTFGGLTSGSGGLAQLGPGTVILTNNNTYTGGTIISAGTLQLGNGGTSGSIVGNVVDNGTLAFDRSDTVTFGGTVSGSGGLTQLGSGTVILTGIDTYTGGTLVQSGVLEVNGSIANSSLTTVMNGAALFGTGTVGNTQIDSGGMFAPGALGSPGSSMNVSGNLAFLSGALYLVQLNPTTSTFANVTGTASLNGTVDAVFAPGSYMEKQYTILMASGGISGTFASIATFGLPADFTATLSYSANDVFLNLKASIPVTGLTLNQQNVGNALNNFFNGGGALPPTFIPIFNLTSANLANALTQLDGEVATGADKGVFLLMDEFLSVMLDPFVDGRIGGLGGAATGFAPDREAAFPPDVALAYAGVLKAPAAPAAFVQRWTTWGSAFGGGQTTQGNAVIGSTNVSAQAAGFAGGMDYHLSPDTVVGFGFSGGETGWSLAQGLGTGRSDAFQAGVYATTHAGPAYVAAALAGAEHWMSTSRVALGDQLSASFHGDAWGARVETGYRYALWSGIGVTPYAAAQYQAFHTPFYRETDATSGGFGLSYNAQNATDTRSELGFRFDDLTTAWGTPLLLRGRVAWAHDWASNPLLSAAFEALPGANFVVNGAAMPSDSALVTAGSEWRLTPRLILLTKFDGEFAPTAQSYAGSGTLRYSW